MIKLQKERIKFDLSLSQGIENGAPDSKIYFDTAS